MKTKISLIEQFFMKYSDRPPVESGKILSHEIILRNMSREELTEALVRSGDHEVRRHLINRELRYRDENVASLFRQRLYLSQ